MADAPTRLEDVKIGMPLGFTVKWLLDGAVQDCDVSLISCHMRHAIEGNLGFATVTKVDTGVFAVTKDSSGMKPGDVFFDVKRASNPVLITPTMVIKLIKAETP